MTFETGIVVLLVWFVADLIHDCLGKYIYCNRKKEKNNRKRCYFWNCKEWHDCPYNGD